MVAESGAKPKATAGTIKVKKKPTTKVSSTGVVVSEVYCRRCMKFLPPINFYQAVDSVLDKNGYLSVCKNCIGSLHSKIFQTEHTIQRTILRLCRMLNIRYSEDAVNATIAHLETAKKLPDDPSTFGIYKAKLIGTQKKEFKDQSGTDEDLTFIEPGNGVAAIELSDDVEDKSYLERFWGKGFVYDDYAFLEAELGEWQKTHKSDTKAEITLLKELCYKSLEIRKARIEERPTATLVKELQELMKTASVDPAKTAIAGSGKSQDTFSAFIKTIEENEPAEYYQDKALFRDFDNIEFYFKKYVTRPLKNFITQSRDFSVETDDDGPEEDIDGEIINADFQ